MEVLRVEPDLPAEKRRVEAGLLPAGVARDGDRDVRARLVLVGVERAAGREADASRAEEISGDELDEPPLHHVAGRLTGHRERERDELVEHVVAIADVDVVGIREVAVRVGWGSVAAVQPDHLAGAPRQRPKQQRVDEREHRAVDADAEREHEDHDQAERRRAPPHPDRVAEILEQRVEEGQAALIPVRFLRLRDAAEVAQCRLFGVGARQAAPLMLVDEQIEMCAHLFVELVVAASRAEESRESRREHAHQGHGYSHLNAINGSTRAARRAGR
jgi:hypothetical protein